MSLFSLFIDPLQPCVYHVLLKAELRCRLAEWRVFVRKRINLSCFPVIPEFQNIINRNCNVLGIDSGRILEKQLENVDNT